MYPTTDQPIPPNTDIMSFIHYIGNGIKIKLIGGPNSGTECFLKISHMGSTVLYFRDTTPARQYVRSPFLLFQYDLITVEEPCRIKFCNRTRGTTIQIIEFQTISVRNYVMSVFDELAEIFTSDVDSFPDYSDDDIESDDETESDDE